MLTVLFCVAQSADTCHAPVPAGRFVARSGPYSLERKMQYHPSCDFIIISRMGDSNSLHRHRPFQAAISICIENGAVTLPRLDLLALWESFAGAEIKNICPLTLFLL